MGRENSMCKGLEVGKACVARGIEMRLTRPDSAENAFVLILFLQLPGTQ